MIGRVGSLALVVLAALCGCTRDADATSPPDEAISVVSSGEGLVDVRPGVPITGVVLMLSGDGGWSSLERSLARHLASRGIAVIGVATPRLLAAQTKASSRCLNPNAALTQLVAGFEHRLGLTDYKRPLLVGYSAGATVAYGALMQAPEGTWAGAVSLGFSPDIAGSKPWCGPALRARTGLISTRSADGFVFAPAGRLPAPWWVIQGEADRVVDVDTARAFVGSVPGARYEELSRTGHALGGPEVWGPALDAALLSFDPQGERDDGALADLPLNPVVDAGAPPTRTLAVLFSGDGGWAGLDREIAAALAARGVPTVGLDSLRYFWTARTPAEAGRDLDRILAHYGRQWGRDRVVLVGYSFGADALPFVYPVLSPALRGAVQRVSLVGLDAKGDLQFHLDDWLDVSADTEMPTVPQIESRPTAPWQCIRGADEADDACAALPAAVARQVVLPGGHHFAGNADALADAILNGVPLS